MDKAKGETLARLVERSAEYDDHKHDHVLAAPALSVEALSYSGSERDTDTYLVTPPELFGQTAPMLPTEHAWRQLFKKLGPIVFGEGSPKTLPFDYLMAVNPEVRAFVLNGHLQSASDRRWMVRGYDGTARAVVGDNYTDIRNTEMLQALDMAIGTERDAFPDLKLVRPFVSPDELHVKVIWRNIKPRGADSPYGIGVYMTNYELGGKSFRLWPCIQRHTCTNSIVLENDGGLVLYHAGSLEAKMTQIRAAIGELFGLGAELVNKMILADKDKIPAMTDVLAGLARQYGWDEETTIAVATGTEGHDTRMGVVNGVSYAAHAIKQPGPDQAELEILAGRLLVAPESLFGRAAHVGREIRGFVEA